MPLKIELKPHESIIIGASLITNDGERTRFYIDGNVPILREKFIMREKEANTPSKRVYFVVQQMYLEKGNKELQNLYVEYVRDLQNAAPSLIPYIMPVSENILKNEYYAAIKCAGKLVEKETEFFGKTLSGEPE
ncbi:MAG: flagellar biosynthesis repressor FlbT [Alphaproteobacteria bacterium]|nr:flagellar biosynthesis repressor FlbT [Alphaproteobacteria bacterium]MBQ8631966.1 flagellar biosynthesis repressor FlbT [Alphaproteobacteria bacterium]